jgi:D-glycero-D-manno-heptose 1,7-bisphosphate phosphatase
VTGVPAVFLDRDGVLIEEVIDTEGRPRAAASCDELVIVPGAARALARLREEGFALVVVTNQPGVARGTVASTTLEAMHRVLHEQLPLDAIECCPHDEADACACRKPRPGMVLRAARALDLDLGSSWLVGDRWVDIAAARAAGVRAILVERPWSWRPTRGGAPPPMLEPDASVTDIEAAAALIITKAVDARSGRRGGHA